MFSLPLTVALSTLPGARQLQKSYAKAYTESLAKKNIRSGGGATLTPGLSVVEGKHSRTDGQDG